MVWSRVEGEEEHAVRRVMTKEISGKRKRGRPMCAEVGLIAGEEGDGAYWRARINSQTNRPTWLLSELDMWRGRL